ncbi:MAG: kinase [Bacillota bacterium]
MFQAEVKVPGSCGELVQGRINGDDFLVTCPIDRFSRCKVKLSYNYSGIKVNPAGSYKSIKAVKLTLALLDKKELGAEVHINSDLIQGKGMASSSADISAVTGGLLVALGEKIDLNLIKNIALKIEPTDGVFLPGINLFDHISGEKYKKLGEVLELDVLIFTEKGKINTCEFNVKSNLKKLKLQKEPLVKRAFDLLKTGFEKNDRIKIARGATLSSIAHQKIIFKPYLNSLLDFINIYKFIYGINIAHSGKLIGILINPEVNNKAITELVKTIERKYVKLKFTGRNSIISGGLRLV